METNPQNQKKPKKKDSLTYVNDFIASLNKNMVKMPQPSQQKACKILSAILENNITLIKKYSYEGLPSELPILRAFIWKLLLHYLPDEPKKNGRNFKSKKGSIYIL